MRGGLKKCALGLGLFGAVLSLGCSKDSKRKKGDEPAFVTVLRVESPSPESSGAEHCEEGGKNCSPLAPKQKIKPEGVVRTFAGGKVSLDFGNGRRVDLGSLSETVLTPKLVALKSGDFAVETTPVIQKEPILPFRFSVADRILSTAPGTDTTSSLSVRPDETLLTVRRGHIAGMDIVPGFSNHSPQAGQTVRLASAQIYRTGIAGQELPSLGPVAPRTGEFGGLLQDRPQEQPRGLGTMTARLPNTDQVRDGVFLKKHHVRVVIRDGYARTEVEEEFENSTPHILEGKYRFPVPGDASLSRLALWVGDELIEGEVLERKRAAAIYKSIVDRPVPRDPALLEWVTGGEMSLKVFPILPKKSRKVVLAYNQALPTEGGVLRYSYPLSLGQGRETKIEDLSITVHLSESRAQVRNPRVLGYQGKVGREGAWHTAHVELKQAFPTRDFVFEVERDIEPTAQLSTYFPGKERAKLPSGVTRTSEDDMPALGSPGTLAATRYQPPEEGGYFALRVSADLPANVERPLPTLQDRALIIDVSQSQSQESLRAEAALAYAMIREMGPGEHYVLLACDSACATFPTIGMKEASRGHLDAARDWLVELAPGGSSDIAGALAAAATRLKGEKRPSRDRQLIYIGDGKASSGELSAETILRRVQGSLAGLDLRFFASGRTVDQDTLFGLASRLGGTLDQVLATGSLEDRLLELSISLRRPVLKGATLRLPPSLRSSRNAALPALRLGQEFIVTGEILGQPLGELVLEGTLEDKPYRLVKALQEPHGKAEQNPLVVKLWAQSKIAELQEQAETPEGIADIVLLSQKFRTMSRHTSFLVLESEEMYRDFGVARTSRSKEDQPDASFLDRFSESESESATISDAKDVTSFEDLEEPSSPREEAARTASKSSPVPASAPKRKPSDLSSAGSGASSSGGMGVGGLGASGRGTLDPWDETMPPGAIAPRPHHPIYRPRPPRARLRFAQENDAWRTWGEENVAALHKKLKENPESRAVTEAYIRGHLKSGRFEAARRAAEEFIKLDPDYAPARQLLAYSSVVDGDHETARKMLDIQTEASPRDSSAHAESARSFEVVGDAVRACAHYRSLAELAPSLTDAQLQAEQCWREVSGQAPQQTAPKKDGLAGQLQIEVVCDEGIRPQDCPSPVAVSPDGRVLSPWTPGTGKSDRSSVTFVKLRTGDYHVLVVGGAPQAKGKLFLRGRHENQAFRFESGAMHTVAKVSAAFY